MRREKGRGVERQRATFSFPSRLFFFLSSSFCLCACQLLPPLPLLAPPLFQTLLPLLSLVLSLDLLFLFSLRARARGRLPAGCPQSPMPRGPFPEARATRRPRPRTDQGGGGLLTTREPTLSRLHAAFFLVGRAGRRRADILVVAREKSEKTKLTSFFFFEKMKQKQGERKDENEKKKVRKKIGKNSKTQIKKRKTRQHNQAAGGSAPYPRPRSGVLAAAQPTCAQARAGLLSGVFVRGEGTTPSSRRRRCRQNEKSETFSDDLFFLILLPLKQALSSASASASASSPWLLHNSSIFLFQVNLKVSEEKIRERERERGKQTLSKATKTVERRRFFFVFFEEKKTGGKQILCRFRSTAFHCS